MTITQKQFERLAKILGKRKDILIANDADAIEVIECLEPHAVPLFKNKVDIKLLEHLVRTCQIVEAKAGSIDNFFTNYVSLGLIHNLTEYEGMSTIISIPINK